MKRAQVALLTILPAIAMIVWLSWTVSVQAQQAPGSPTTGAAQEQSIPPQADRNAATEAKTFKGKILKSGDKFVLADSANKVIYQLDDQQKAEPFLNKSVKVTGVVDGTSDMIRVTAIDPV
jgi:uncharacterized protein DUF5818